MERLDKMPKWLGITNQQFNILEAMLSLQRKGSLASPKLIINEDAALRNVPKIQKSNFFSQLKSLRGFGYVMKVGAAAYAVDFNNIKKSLESAESQAVRESYELKELKSEVEQKFKSLAVRGKEPSLEFMDYARMYSKIADITSKRDSFLSAAVFPKVLYANSPSLMRQPEAQRYAQTLWLRCVTTGELEVKYLTYFDIKYLFSRLNAVYKNPALTYGEISRVLESIPELLENSKKLSIYYTDAPYGLDMTILQDEHVEDLFLLIRDTNKVGKGCIYIKSPELAMEFRSIFLEDCDECVDMRSSAGERIIKKLEARLDKEYQKYKRKKNP